MRSKGRTARAGLVRDPLFRKGLRIRKAVVGKDYVERRLKEADRYAWPFEEAATRFAWGAVWGRPGLSRKTRSFLNLAALTAMNMRHELKTHVRGALRNGITRKEIAEALLHCAVYCGFPKALDALRLMQEAFEEMDLAARRKKKRSK